MGKDEMREIIKRWMEGQFFNFISLEMTFPSFIPFYLVLNMIYVNQYFFFLSLSNSMSLLHAQLHCYRPYHVSNEFYCHVKCHRVILNENLRRTDVGIEKVGCSYRVLLMFS